MRVRARVVRAGSPQTKRIRKASVHESMKIMCMVNLVQQQGAGWTPWMTLGQSDTIN